MASKSKSKSEGEGWYASAAGRKQTQREFERALKQDSVMEPPLSRVPLTDPKVLAALVEQAKAKATRAISIRVPIADLERAQEIAAKIGTGYQTVLKRAIRAGLKRVS